MANNQVLINYGSGTNPISTIAGWIDTGYASGAWNGHGIISSIAQTNPNYGLGYADAADANNPAGLPAGEIKIMYTLLGDANLDGTVNSEDFTLFSQNLGLSGMMWDKGDFNYDGTVNSEDFTLCRTISASPPRSPRPPWCRRAASRLLQHPQPHRLSPAQ